MSDKTNMAEIKKLDKSKTSLYIYINETLYDCKNCLKVLQGGNCMVASVLKVPCPFLVTN